MRRRVLLSLFALTWLLVLVAVAVGWGPFAGSSLPVSRGTRHAVPAWIYYENLPPNAVLGAKLFAVAGCTDCHTYAGYGSQRLGAPDLTAIGTRRLGVAFEIRHLRCPSCVHPGSPMPSYASFGRMRLREIAIFLEASRGTR